MKQDLPAGEDHQQFSRVQYETWVKIGVGKSTRTTERSQDQQASRPKQTDERSEQRTVQVEKIDDQVERSLRQSRAGFQIDLRGSHRKTTASRLPGQLFKRFRREIDRGHVKVLLGKEQGIAPGAAGHIEDAPLIEEGQDPLQPGVDLPIRQR